MNFKTCETLALLFILHNVRLQEDIEIVKKFDKSYLYYTM